LDIAIRVLAAAPDHRRTKKLWGGRTREAQPLQRRAHIGEVEVAVDLRGDRRVAVAEDALDDRQGRSRTEQQRRRRVPVMEPHGPLHGARPELHPARRATP